MLRPADGGEVWEGRLFVRVLLETAAVEQGGGMVGLARAVHLVERLLEVFGERLHL